MALTRITSDGITDGTITGTDLATNIDLVDNQKLRIGTGNDLQIFHDGNSRIVNTTNYLTIKSDQFALQNQAGDHDYITVPTANQNVRLHYDNVVKFQTQSWGCEVTGQLHATGSVKVEDNAEIQIGTSADLKIYHDGTNNQLLATNGPIHMYTGTAIELRKGYDGSYETMLKAVPNGAVELYYDNYKAYVTNGGGGASNGMLSADSVLNLNTSQDGSGSDYFVRGSKNSTAVGAGSDVFWIYEDGDMYNVNGTFSQSSDIKLKENIVDASSQWSDIKALKVRKFNFKASTGYGTHTQIGMVAQEVETTCPGLITERVDLQKTENSDKTWTETDTGEKTKSIKLTVLYMKAVKALQEAMTRIETLETKVAALEAA